MIRIYRRHNEKCLTDLRAANPKLQGKAWRKFQENFDGCDCPYWLRGVPGQREQSLKADTGEFVRDRKTAEALLKGKDAAQKNTAVHGDTLENAIVWYLDSRTDLAPETHEQYEAVLGVTRTDPKAKYEVASSGLLRYAHDNGIYHAQELTVDFIEKFKVYGMGDIVDSTKKTRFAKVLQFLKTAKRRGWILVNLIEDLDRIHVSPKGSQPFNVVPGMTEWNEDEVNRILEVAGTLKSRSGYGSNPATFGLQCELMNETGMRDSDTISFDPRLCTPYNGLWQYKYYPKKQVHSKTPKQATVYLTDRLKSAIESCVWMGPTVLVVTERGDRIGLPFAYCGPIYRFPMKPAKGEVDLTKKLALEVYKHLKVVGRKVGVLDCRPHRFRDTFAVRLIMAGMSLTNVSKALNHSKSIITEMYYLCWFEARTKDFVSEFHGIISTLHPVRLEKAA